MAAQERLAERDGHVAGNPCTFISLPEAQCDSDADELADEWRWQNRDASSTEQRRLEAVAAQGLVQRRAQRAASEERAVQVTYYDGSGRRVVYEGHVQLATNGVREARRRATVRAMARPCGGRRGRGRWKAS